jgi:hypothetical protein
MHIRENGCKGDLRLIAKCGCDDRGKIAMSETVSELVGIYALDSLLE